MSSAPSTASDIASYAHEESNWSRLVVHLQRWVQYNRRSVMLTITLPFMRSTVAQRIMTVNSSLAR